MLIRRSIIVLVACSVAVQRQSLPISSAPSSCYSSGRHFPASLLIGCDQVCHLVFMLVITGTR